MNLFLIGCTGFIGRELIERLMNSEHRLTVLSRKDATKTSKRINHLRLDPKNSSTWQKELIINELNQSDGIINLVGEPIAEKRWSPAHCELLKESRIKTTQYLIQAISKLKKPPKVLINASAIGFYGTSRSMEFTEESESGKDFLANLCNDWEQSAKQKRRETRLLILRIGIVIGPGGGALGKMLPIFRTGFGGPIGDGKQWMSWIHRTDLCNIIETSLTNNSWKGVINAVAPQPVRMSDFSHTLGQTLDRPSLLPVPSPILKLLLGDGAMVVIEGQCVKSNLLKKLNYQFIYPDLTTALADATKLKNH